jgi:phospholipase C
MFASNFDASSFISHQYIIAGQASSAVNYPAGLWGCDGGPNDMIDTVTQQRQIPGGQIRTCFENETLGDELDKAHLSWGYYTSSLNRDGALWSAYQVIKHIRYGSDWKKDIINPQTKFFGDIKHGRLRTFSWITPTCANSDHAGCGSNHGPSWVTSLVNAVGRSKYWPSTVVFVFWDDYGGWYDNDAPSLVDYDGLGMRIPLLVISAYSKRGYVSHVNYEHGSLLRFVEDQFGLGRLSQSDARANSPDPDCFDFSKAPRKFVPIGSPLDQNYFMHEPMDYRVPDSE